MGQIVYAATEGDWYNQRLEYLSKLPDRARVRLQQVACEAVEYMADQLAATHKLNGNAIKKFLQTGNPDDLGGLPLGSFRQYKEVLELLIKASGQDKISTVNVKGEIVHTQTEAPASGGVRSLAEIAREKKIVEDKERARLKDKDD